MQNFNIELTFKNAQGSVGGTYRTNTIEDALSRALHDAASYNGYPTIRAQGPDGHWYTFRRAKQLWYKFEFNA